MSDVVLVGPFWTRSEAAAYLGITGDELLDRNDVVRLEGRWLEETYPSLQFRNNEIRHEVAEVVVQVGDEVPGAAIADWLSRPNPLLGTMSPIDWFNAGLALKTAITAVHADLDSMKSRIEAPPTAAIA